MTHSNNGFNVIMWEEGGVWHVRCRDSSQTTWRGIWRVFHQKARAVSLYKRFVRIANM